MSVFRQRRNRRGGKSGRRWGARTLLVAVLAAAVLAAIGAVAFAANDPVGVSFTLEGCKLSNDTATYDPDTGSLICSDGAYTTGNLGKQWNELDLVPHRVTTHAGNSAPDTQTYQINVVADHEDAGFPGYDVLSAPVLNAVSDASCSVIVGPETVLDPGVGGTDKSLARSLDITQDKNTTCVFDYYERLAVGSHLFPGSSLHSNLLNKDLETGGIGNKDVSIPVKEIEPQELDKTMTATQDEDRVWDVTKSPTPASIDFGCTCDPGNADPSEEVKIRVDWEILSVNPTDITVITHVYATNPAAREIETTVVDEIFGVLDGDIAESSLGTASATEIVPKNTSNFLILTHILTVPSGTTGLHDVATGTYEDVLTGVPVPGETTAEASADVQIGDSLNTTAVITDVEGISGAGLSYSVDAVAGATGAFGGGYVLGTETTGDVTWVSDSQSGAGYVEFTKTVYFDGPGSVSGSLDDTATLVGSDGFTTSADASITISAEVSVDLTIDKTITAGVLNGSETETFVFDIEGPNGYTNQVSLTFGAGETNKSVTITGLEPGTYTVTEQDKPYWTEEGPKNITFDPATNGVVDCTGTLFFGNDFDPSLTVTKDVTATYSDRYDWDITKTVEPPSQSGFAGDTLEWTWSITWNSFFVEQINHDVSGTIDIFNPMPYAATVDVSDVLDDATPVTVDCGAGATSVTVASLATETCSYSASPANDDATLNTATATFFDEDFTGSANVNWINAGDVGLDATISDTNNEDIPVGSDQPFTYTNEATCSTESGAYGEDGSYSGDASNTATIVWTGGSDDSTADTAYDCYLWEVSKTAEGTYDEEYGWDITKTVKPPSQSGFAGDTLDWTWSITWNSFLENELNHDVEGVITVTNPADIELTVDVTDELTGPVAGTVVCNDGDLGTDLTIPANSSGTCDYTAAPGSQLAQNTAWATRNAVSVSDTVDVTWTLGNQSGLDATITDDSGISIPDDTQQPYTYTDDATCSTDQADYTNGKYPSGLIENKATITWTGGSDDSTASTSYDCYAPLIDKTVYTATYDERHDWEISKSANPVSQSGFPGDTLPWNWTVNVSETPVNVADSYEVFGDIKVSNPAGSPGDMIVSLADVLDDGTVALVDCGFGATSVTVAPGTTETCSYIATPPNFSATENTATGTFNGGDFTDTEAVSFTANVIDGSATVTDIQIGLNENLTAGDGPWDYTGGDDSVTCSTLRSAYSPDNPYGETLYNTAYLDPSDGPQLSADADTTWDCSASFVEINKYLNDVPATNDPNIQFTLFKGTVELETLGTGTEGSNLVYQTALRPGETYTMCEYPVPAGYTFEVTLNGEGVNTYPGPPDASNPTGEVQCFDFVAADSPTELTFEINNSFPGGAPRTPGYWKNWNTCTTGNQEQTAANLGGTDAGVYLLDDLIPEFGLVGDLLVETCEVGVLVLDSRWAVGPKDGKQASSDAAYELARNYFAARLNKGAGACEVTEYTFDTREGDDRTFEQVKLEAQEFLLYLGYDGNGAILTPKEVKKKNATFTPEDRTYALFLAGILDDYNNSEFCQGDESH